MQKILEKIAAVVASAAQAENFTQAQIDQQIELEYFEFNLLGKVKRKHFYIVQKLVAQQMQ